MITIKNLEFSYGDNKVLSNISLNLEQGKIYGLLGENGVGKTTLLTLLCGLKKPQYGSIEIDGQIPSDREPSLLGKIYYLPDETDAPTITGTEYAERYGRFWNGFDMDKFNRIMELFETDPSKKMSAMSFGMIKKTYISFALATNAPYLFMDEPTNGLDIPSKAQFRKVLNKFTSDESTLLISTHQVRDLEAIIDPIIILDKQDVLLNASIEDITRRLYFEYGNDETENVLYSEMIPGGNIQVCLNRYGMESKVNIEALFNAVQKNKSLIKKLFA